MSPAQKIRVVGPDINIVNLPTFHVCVLMTDPVDTALSGGSLITG